VFRRFTIAMTVALALLGGGCASGEDTAAEDTIATEDTVAADTGAATAAQTGGAAPSADEPMLLTEADIETFRRGKEAELAHAVRQADEMKRAKSGTDTLKVMATLMEWTVDSAGARGAGLSPESYHRLENAVESVLRQWRQIGMQSTLLNQMKSSDTTGQSAEMRAVVREGEERMRSEIERLEKYEGLPPQNVQLVTRQAAQLDSLVWRVLGAMAAPLR
jgi:hypothetical protein